MLADAAIQWAAIPIGHAGTADIKFWTIQIIQMRLMITDVIDDIRSKPGSTTAHTAGLKQARG
jgi:hypothetical protein